MQMIPMQPEDYEKFKKKSLAAYAVDLAQADGISVEEAAKKAKKVFETLLPSGLQTEGHYFFLVKTAEQETAGNFWFQIREADQRKMAFVADIFFERNFRGRGLGTEVLTWFEGEARRLGAERLGLHVFGHNPGARKLYERLGYMAKNIVMAKDL